MTGYGSGQFLGPDSERLHIEIRSVNNRFLDLSFKLPDELRAHESSARDALSQGFKRGKLELRAALQRQGAASGAPSPEWLRQLAGWQAAIQAELPQARALSVADVLRLNTSEGSSAEAADLAEPFKAACAAAIEALKAARAAEGARMVAMLEDRIAQLRALSQAAAPLLPAAVAQQQQRFLERYKDALQSAASAGGSIDPQAAQERALAEAASFAIRIDVAEELTRLNAHLDEISGLLAKGGELGKRLDFLIQELHREANTLGSKASSMDLSRISVDMRVLVEQMREQVQNIE
jgi:uncharacterized protein (TIGR00255 family)